MYSFTKSLPVFGRHPRAPQLTLTNRDLYTHLLWITLLVALTLGLLMVYVVYPVLASEISDYVQGTGLANARLPASFFWWLPLLALAEEVIFRLKFVPNLFAFFCGNWAFWNLSVAMIRVFASRGELTEAIVISWINTSLLSGCAILGVWLIFPGVVRSLRSLQERYLGLYIGFSALVFGWIHILNYAYASVAPWPVWLGMVVPQIFLGVVFTWVCIHRSFWQAWLFHTAYNVVLFALAQLGSFENDFLLSIVASILSGVCLWRLFLDLTAHPLTLPAKP